MTAVGTDFVRLLVEVRCRDSGAAAGTPPQEGSDHRYTGALAKQCPVNGAATGSPPQEGGSSSAGEPAH